jgi:hexosaminidase
MLPIIPKPHISTINPSITYDMSEIQIHCDISFLKKHTTTFINSYDGITIAKNGAPFNIKIGEINYDSEEAYNLDVTKNSISIIANSEKGLFYGLQSFIQLVAQYGPMLPEVSIKDTPRYAYRGFMLDVSRHFFDSKSIKNYLDILSTLKINVFHFHLSDDQGYRIESKKYPNLNTVGSVRSHTVIRGKSDHTPVNGFYKLSELKELVEYAKERHIMIIPEIDMPGHFTSILASYPHLGCTNRHVDVMCRPGISLDTACPGKESTYEFIEELLDELLDVFESPYVHIGGDEAPKIRWYECEDCQTRIKQEHLRDEHELQGYLMNRITKHIQSKGKQTIVWNDAIRSGNIQDSTIMQYWMDGKNNKTVLQEINTGRKTIMSARERTYLDYPYSMTSLKKTYEYNPILTGVEESAVNNIIGIEAPLWTELIPTNDRLEYMLFPRICAISEVAWSPEKSRDYDDFQLRLKSFNKILDQHSINYATKEEYDIRGLKGIVQTVTHVRNMLSYETIKNLFKMSKAAKKARKSRNTQ